MNTPVDLASGESSWVPVDACTLPTTAQPLRVAERAHDMADREAGCCSFFEFSVTASEHDPHGVLVDITVPENRADVLAALADSAESHLAGKGLRR